MSKNQKRAKRVTDEYDRNPFSKSFMTNREKILL